METFFTATVPKIIKTVSLLLQEVELMETLGLPWISEASKKSLLLQEVELMETLQFPTTQSRLLRIIASFIGSGINGNRLF